jgi:uncharacterized repeat protein (TIGR01451 family)
MKTPSRQKRPWLALLAILVILSTFIPGVAMAQDTAPPDPVTRYEVASGPDEAEGAPSVAPEQEELPAESQPPEVAPVAAWSPATASAVAPQGVQGVVTLDVSVPDSIRASEFITYTYSYQNTGGTAISNVVIKAIWANFSISTNGNWQFCEANLCDVLTGSVVGPPVARIKSPASNDPTAQYQISGGLAAGQSGSFSVRLRTKADIYPKTNQAPTRPSGSGQVLLNGSTTPTSEDTAATLVVGPVLSMTKTTDTTKKIYPLESAEFVITVGNATGSGDKPDGVIRADARTATNIVLVDTLPVDSEFVSATPTPTSVANGKITWTIASLVPGQSQQIRVTFKKTDANTNNQCEQLKNVAYNVTSNEYPFNGSVRYTVVQTQQPFATVVPPLKIKSVTASPTTTYFGSQAVITIVVQNYWNQPLNGVLLHYDIQSNAFYAGSATPAPSATPNASLPGGRVTWTFNIAAGDKTTPREATFSFNVLGGFTKTVAAGTGRAQIVPPAGAVPSACIKTLDGRVGLTPRLRITKTTDLDASTRIADYYVVTRQQTVNYIIEVENRGGGDATNVTVRDIPPNGSNANFTFIGATPTPSSIAPNLITWSGLTVPAGQKITIQYTMKVDGQEFYKYCNFFSATAGSDGSEEVEKSGPPVCVKINPRITIVKSVDKTTANPGDVVQFDLTLTNNETTAYEVGLFDWLHEFQFDSQVSGYGAPQLSTRSGWSGANGYEWPMVSLAPGAQLKAVIKAKVPTVCTTRDYVNELLFLFKSTFDQQTYIVRSEPRMEAKVRVTCGKIEYSKTADRNNTNNPASLRDRIMYTLQIKNADGSPANSVGVEDILPTGFTYDGMDSGSGFKSEPSKATGADGRIKLTWTIPNIPANTATNIKFFARSGDIVGDYQNWVIVPTSGKCLGACVTDQDGKLYSTSTVKVQPLITMEPKILETGCAQPTDKRTYQLTILNTNNHDYSTTVVSVTLPLGLRFAGTSGSTPPPGVIAGANGSSIVRWDNLKIPAKPSGQVASQIVLAVQLQVGQAWGNLDTLVQTSSPDGLIPRKDGVLDPTVPVCPSQPAIAKDVDKTFARVGDELVYQISLANTNPTPLTATVTDQLPAGVTFVAPIVGPPPLGPAPTVSGSTLTWTDNSIPPASGGEPGTVLLQFRVRVQSLSEGGSIVNTAEVSPGGVFDTRFNSVTVVSPRLVFLPIVRR